MKYLLITGSYPPDICGVGDYTSKLMARASDDWELYYDTNWKISSIMKHLKKINSTNSDVIFLQYPTQGYGWSLVPQILCLYYSFFSKKKFIVVLHEFSQRKFKAKLATSFLMLANKIIFTTKYEQDFSKKKFPWIKDKCSVIKILSNINTPSRLNPLNKRSYDICYFGHLRPNKGLECFFKTVKRLHPKPNELKIIIIGQLLPEFSKYFETLQNEYRTLNIRYFLNQRDVEVSNLLNNTKIAYLPFPDGLSERRGSLLAAIANGCIPVSTEGQFTTKELRDMSIIVDEYNSHIKIQELLATMSDDSYNSFQSRIKEYQKTLPSNWDEIRLSYIKATQ
ncbi:MAG: glycosyltransferase [Lachnospiraceae bacterium]|nr:glycosyltransferase [Lachnospiraceae bacterium]